MGKDAQPSEGRAGRPPNPVTGPEPGRSYIRELVRWQTEVAGITRRELAQRAGISPSVISEFLGKVEDGWRPTQKRLDTALAIIAALRRR